MKHEMIIGKKDGRQVKLEWELILKNPNGSQFNMYNKLMNDSWWQLSISASSANWAGQAYDELLSMDEIYMDQSRLEQLVEYWKRWHLNDMRPYCIHQREWDRNKKLTIIKVKTNTWKVKDQILSRIISLLNMDVHSKKELIEFQSKLGRYEHNYFQFTKLVKKVKLAALRNEKYIPEKDWEKSWFEQGVIEYEEEEAIAHWTSPIKHPDGILGKECTECQYSYGSKWLIEPLPDEVRKFFANLHLFISMDKQINEIDQWMIDNDVKVHAIMHVNMNPHIPNQTDMDHWEFRFDCGSKSDRFWYSTGHGHRLGHGEHNDGMKLSFKLNNYKKKLRKLYGNEVKIYVNQSGLGEWDGIPKPPMPRDVFYQLFEDVSYLKQFSDAMDFGSETGYDCNDHEQRHTINRIWNNMQELERKLNQLVGYDKTEEFIETFCH